MTMINRELDNIDSRKSLTEMEINILDVLKPDNKTKKKFLSDYIF